MTARGLLSPAALARAGLLRHEDVAALAPVAARYAIAVTPEMAALIDPANLADDPIARQFLPSLEELSIRPDELADPIGDAAHSPLAGLVHRYPDRVLLMPTHACPVYCRFCFRREVVGPGGAGALGDAELEAAFAYVAARPAIEEVIVTGGDPLVLSPRRLARIADGLARIRHVRVLRLHSRVPVVSPNRVSDGLIASIRRPEFATYLGLHANHPRELGEAARAAIARLADAGVVVVSQTVLLAGINDDVETLAELFRAFVANRVRPYYLHHLDRAPGTARFRVPIAKGRALMRALRGRLSGLAQPTYVLDIPGGRGKSPIGPNYFAEGRSGAHRIEDFRGGVVDWRE